jgi:replicative DNA helicase
MQKGECSLKIAELEAKIDLLSLIERNHTVKREGKTYRVNPCPVCGHNDHFTVYPETNSYSSFNGCCQGGSVYKYLQEVEGFSEAEAWEVLNQMASVAVAVEERPKEKSAKPHQPTKAEGEAPNPDYTAEILRLYHMQTEQDRAYFLNRGIPAELIEKYKLCVVNDGGRRAVLPIWSGGKVTYYTVRALENQKPRYKNTPGPAPLFNIDYIRQASGSDLIIITEGIFDALSIEAEGYKAIALGGAEHAGKLMEAIEQNPEAKKIIFFTAFDNDEPGREAAAKLPFKALQIPAQYKDVNEWRIAEPGAVRESIREQISAAARPDAVSEYLSRAFITDIEKFKTYKDKKTGFSNLDSEMNGLYAGLYVVGGISSVGKTTFIHQLGDQLAEQGDHIIYFSLEQSKLELVSKSLARITAKQDYNNAVSGISIRSGYIPEQVIKAAEAYQEIAKRVNIIEGNFNTTVESMRAYIERYMLFNRVKPVVIIDYLQIIPGDPRLGDKQRVDNIVTELKRISRDFDITVFVISSLNRGNYLAPVDFETLIPHPLLGGIDVFDVKLPI